MNIIRIFILCIFISGCSSHYSMKCRPSSSANIPEIGELPIKQLTSSSNYSDIMKAYVATVYIQKKYIDSITSIMGSM